MLKRRVSVGGHAESARAKQSRRVSVSRTLPTSRPLHANFWTKLIHRTLRALWLARDANLPAMVDHAVGEIDPFALAARSASGPARSSPGPCASVSPSRRLSRVTCVSTTTPVASPKAVPSTTFAVLRPTPGSATSCSMSRGTSPSCSLDDRQAGRLDVLRLVAEEAGALNDLLELS